ncbi:glycosyltransferase [Winogradskyella sp. A2]|uniref:glycosyltransferase n=1 Tax=Winogradskyella sp. A2 TaxID=3366944 RepID=UPI00398C6829
MLRSIDRSKGCLKVLISTYACGPNWGSEIGMGWNWIIHLSKYCKLYVITEFGFKEDIEQKIPELNLKYTPVFYYIDIGNKGRELFWKQGSFIFYHHYKLWQKKALKTALKIVEKQEINLVHQLNMIGFREPGYLFNIDNIPFVWGPVGGYNQVPWRYIKDMKLSNIFYYSIKNIINQIQIRGLFRPKKAAKRADLLFAATQESLVNLSKYSSVRPILLNETGCSLECQGGNSKLGKTLNIVWVGKIQGLKALPIALKSLSKIKEEVDFVMTIIGEGPDLKACQELALDLNIAGNCIWMGKVENTKVIEIMRKSSFLFFTSLKEGTPHVVTEALQNGLPVLCHDACGHGVVVDGTCGVKIPMQNQKYSIDCFATEIINIFKNQSILRELSQGCLQKAKSITWDSKANYLFNKYFDLTK